jgi:hypothetical protein
MGTFFRSVGRLLYTGLTVVVKIILPTFSINIHQNIYFQQNAGQGQQISMIGKGHIQSNHPYSQNSYSCKKIIFLLSIMQINLFLKTFIKWFPYKSRTTLNLPYN